MSTPDARHQRSFDAAQRIETARRRVVPKLSARAAAKRAGVSEGWWRKVVRGFERHGWDIDPATGSDETLLAMAAVVGIREEIAATLGVTEAIQPIREIGHKEAEAILDNLTEDERDWAQEMAADLMQVARGEKPRDPAAVEDVLRIHRKRGA